MANKLTLESEVKASYTTVNNRTKMLKIAVVVFCADIDRTFREVTKINIREQADEETFNKVKQSFFNLRGMTLDQFNRALILFITIRDINAHLYMKKPIFIDEDLIEYFSKIAKPIKAIAIERKLTMFGMAYVLSFFAIRYQIWNFCAHFFKTSYFEDVGKNGPSEYQSYFNAYVKHRAVRYNNPGYVDNVDVPYLNATYRNNIVNIIFEMERASFNKIKSTPYELYGSFQSLMSKISVLNGKDELISSISNLRNAILHGFLLFDDFTMNDNQTTINLTPNYIINVLLKVKEAVSVDSNYEEVVASIEQFGTDLLHNYALRLVEVSHKIIDKRLLTAEKLDSRIDNIRSAYERLNTINRERCKNASLLVGGKPVDWTVWQSKFLDFIPRPLFTKTLKIIQLNSEVGFKIGDFVSKQKQIYLVDTETNLEYQNTINGKYLKDIKLEKIEDFCPSISLYKAIL